MKSDTITDDAVADDSELRDLSKRPRRNLPEVHREAETLKPVRQRGVVGLLRQAREQVDWRRLPGLRPKEDVPPPTMLSVMIRRFSVFVLLPTALMAIYLFVFASDQYVVQSQFAVRGNVEPMENAPVGNFASLIQKHNSQDSFIIRDFIVSNALVQRAETTLGISKLFSRDEADFWARHRPPQPLEKLAKFWRYRVFPRIEILSGVVILQVRAFTPQDAVDISKFVIAQSESLVNDMSRRAQRDMIAFAQKDVDKAEERLKNSYRALQAFRNNWGIIDPIKTAENTLGTIEALKTDRMKAENDLRVLRDSKLDERHRSIQTLVATSEAINFQIKRLQEQLTTAGLAAGAQNNITQALLEFETLTIEKTIAEKLNESARNVFEQARIAASKQHLYLATFEPPVLPTYALYPESIYTLFVTFFIFLVCWSVTSLIVAGVKDARL